MVDLDLAFDVDAEKSVQRRVDPDNDMFVPHTYHRHRMLKPRWALVQS